MKEITEKQFEEILKVAAKPLKASDQTIQKKSGGYTSKKARSHIAEDISD